MAMELAGGQAVPVTVAAGRAVSNLPHDGAFDVALEVAYPCAEFNSICGGCFSPPGRVKSIVQVTLWLPRLRFSQIR